MVAINLPTQMPFLSCVAIIIYIYRIAENVGGRKHWRIDGQSPKFSPSILNFRILFAVHVIQVGQRGDVFVKIFSPY